MKLPSNYRLAATVGILFGAFALSALAAGTWTPPTAPPPGGNPDAPVNVGTTAQNKLGPLGVKGLVTTDFTLATGTPAAGKVLTALDSLGNATWATLPVASSASKCNWVNTGPADLSTVDKSLSLVIGGENICADGDGCDVRAFVFSGGNGVNASNSTLYQQSGNNKWSGNNVAGTGVNGDSTKSIIVSSPLVILDDDPVTETSPDNFTVVDDSSSAQYTVAVCD